MNDRVKLWQPSGIAVRAIVTEQVHVVFQDLDKASWFDTAVHRILIKLARSSGYVAGMGSPLVGLLK